MFKIFVRATFLLFTLLASQAQAAFVASGIGNTSNVTFTNAYPNISISINTFGNVTYGDTFLNTTTIAFDWNFSAKHDSQQFSDSGSKAGYKIDNIEFILSPTLNSSGFEIANGSVVVTVNAGSSFTFFSMFSGLGNTNYGIKNISLTTVIDGPTRGGGTSVVPLPASAPLVLSALASFGFMRRRKS